MSHCQDLNCYDQTETDMSAYEWVFRNQGFSLTFTKYSLRKFSLNSAHM